MILNIKDKNVDSDIYLFIMWTGRGVSVLSHETWFVCVFLCVLSVKAVNQSPVERDRQMDGQTVTPQQLTQKQQISWFSDDEDNFMSWQHGTGQVVLFYDGGCFLFPVCAQCLCCSWLSTLLIWFDFISIDHTDMKLTHESNAASHRMTHWVKMKGSGLLAESCLEAACVVLCTSQNKNSELRFSLLCKKVYCLKNVPFAALIRQMNTIRLNVTHADHCNTATNYWQRSACVTLCPVCVHLPRKLCKWCSFKALNCFAVYSGFPLHFFDT